MKNKINLPEKQKKMIKRAAISATAIGGVLIALKVMNKTGLEKKLCDAAIKKLVCLEGTKFHCQYFRASWYNNSIPNEVINKISKFTDETLTPYLSKN